MDHVNGHVDSKDPTCLLSYNGAKRNEESNVQKSTKPNLRIKVSQPIELKNHDLDESESFDTLHSIYEEVSTGFNTQCTEKVCQASIMNIPNRGDVPRTPEEIYKEAEVFFRQYYSSTHRQDTADHKARLERVKTELKETGTYRLKQVEMTFGAKLAWRNASRCIGRIQSGKIKVFDLTDVTTATGMFDALCYHIKYSTNRGNIRSAISVFHQRTDEKHDYRIWNPQLISYAGYREPDGSILGDPARVEFTDICLNLGWKSERTAWDILPLVLSANGKDPEYFEIPREIVMEVMIEHPKYEWFKELGLRWYALPAVSNMRFDCGGLEFTANAFNGWYMGTEIGCRNLCDNKRLNVIERVANKMGLDTSSLSSLWKDQALVEVNIAVLYSYHRDNVSIVDHHTASEQFMKHFEMEHRVRGGCPADWIWIVPPMSSSLTPLFHQEMALYYLRPSYDYQEAAWKTHRWTTTSNTSIVRKRRFNFKQLARAVKFTSKLYGQALSKRIKATILYATETLKSEEYAKELGTLFGHAFNAQVHCMADYDVYSIEHEMLLLIVTSTFGNGEPPSNGAEFMKHLLQMLSNEKKKEEQFENERFKTPTPKRLTRAHSLMTTSTQCSKKLTRLESSKSSIGAYSVEQITPLSNVSYAVFALGSRAYPKFCEFGVMIDDILMQLGGQRIMELTKGDELSGQEQEFRTWSSKIFHAACETFCLDENDTIKNAKKELGNIRLTAKIVQFNKKCNDVPIKKALGVGFKKRLISCKVKEIKLLGIHKETNTATVFVDMETADKADYQPGDHIGVLAHNRKKIVDSVLCRLKTNIDFDDVVQLQVLKESLTPNGLEKTWENHERLPPATIRNIYTRFLDITTPPSTTILKYLASCCTEEIEANELTELSTDSNKYDEWRHYHYPHLAEVLDQFPSCRPQASLLAALLPPLMPRYYSVSSSPLVHPDRIHLTVAVVTYKTQNGKGPMHYGVCSNYLSHLKPEDEVDVFIRSSKKFHMPADVSVPLILIGPGTGIAPFRGFWQHRRHQIMNNPEKNAGPIWLFFGCRCYDMDLYKEEKEAALQEGILAKSNLALSREKGHDKKYVQALLEEEGAEVTRLLIEEHGHFYVCGDCKMAVDVHLTLKGILKKHTKMTEDEVEEFVLDLMDDTRYHEDIYGITSHHGVSRETGRRSRLESLQSQT